MRKLVFACSFILTLFFTNYSYAQLDGIWVKGQLVEVETKDGLLLLGTIQERGTDFMVLSSESIGEYTLDTRYIKKITEIKKESFQNNEYWHENANYSRNFYGPTGMGLKKGHGYYQNLELVWNHIAYAFTDYFTLGIDFEIVSPLLAISGEIDSPLPIMGLTPKFSFPVAQDFYIGTGALVILTPSPEIDFNITLPYLVGTYGNKDKNITLGFGYYFLNVEEFEDERDLEQGPIFTLSGQYRVSKNMALVSENWIISTPESGDIAFIGVQGVRYLGRKLSWDFGIALAGIAGEEFDLIPIPVIGIAFAFDRLPQNKNRK